MANSPSTRASMSFTSSTTPGSRQCVQTIRKHGPKLLDLRHRWIFLFAQRDASLLFHVLVGVNIAETLRRLCVVELRQLFSLAFLDGFDAFDVVESTLDDALLDDVFELLGDLRANHGCGSHDVFKLEICLQGAIHRTFLRARLA